MPTIDGRTSQEHKQGRFYRFWIVAQFALTPNDENIKVPALHPKNSSLWLLGLRARRALKETA